MIQRVRAVFRKEVIDNLRDRRSMSAAFLFTLIGPLVTAGAIGITAKVQADKSERPVVLPVQGAANAPGLVQYLKQHNVTVVRADGDLEAEVKDGKHDVAISIPGGYGADFRSARPATVRLVLDESRSAARHGIKRVRRLLKGYAVRVGKLRLLARGVDPAISEPLAVETVDVSTPESLAALLLGMLPFFIVMAIFIGGYYIVVDSTAGELERGSLEPLFINPASRLEFLLGKFLAAGAFSCVWLAVAMIGFWLVPRFISTEALGIKIDLNALVLLRIFLLVLPLVAFATAVGMIVSTLSKGFKEAQTMLSFIMMLPIIPGLLMTLMPFKTKAWMMLVPILNQQILINEMIRGDTVKGAFMAISVAATTVAAAAGLYLATRLYSGERVFLNR